MGHLGIQEWIVALFMGLLYFAIPIAFGVWVIVALRRIIDGIKRLSSRLDVIEKMLMEKGA
jgi:TRAP-type C4-dicarboxylate transport system permease small subunit